jgi:hypothetical protein
VSYVTIAVSGSYTVGDKLGAVRTDSSGSAYSYNRLSLSVPNSGPGGICSKCLPLLFHPSLLLFTYQFFLQLYDIDSNSYAQYLIPVNHTCTRAITNLQTECALGSASVLAANSYLYNLQVARVYISYRADRPKRCFIL